MAPLEPGTALAVKRRETQRRPPRPRSDDTTWFIVVSIVAHGALYAALRGASPRRYFAEPFVISSLELEFLRPPQRARPSPTPTTPAIELAQPAVRRRAMVQAHSNLAPAVAVALEPTPAASPAPPEEPVARAVVTRPSLSGMRLLESVERDAWRHRGGHTFSTRPQEAPEDPGVRSLDQNVARVRDDWREETLRAAPPPRPSGSSEFVRRYVVETARVWNPTRAQDPSIAEGLLRLLTAGTEGYRAAMTDMLGGFGSPRGAAAGEALDSAHPNSPMLRPSPTLNEAGRATAQRIAVELDVTQAPDGSIVSVRVARTSGTRWFDTQAETALREAIARTSSGSRTARTGGLRSRWEFELRVARNPPIALGPQLPGALVEPPLISGGVEWGGVDPPRPMYPFALHRYQRIRVLWVVPDSPASNTAAPRVDRDAGR